MKSVLFSQYVSFEKPKFVPPAERTCSGTIPCDDENRLIQVNYRLEGVGNRPDSKVTGLKADSQRLDNTWL